MSSIAVKILAQILDLAAKVNILQAEGLRGINDAWHRQDRP